MKKFPRLVVLTAIAVVGVGFGQETAQEASDVVGGLGFIDEVEVTVVNVDVYVRDGKGRPVSGLEVGQFRVVQDGIEMPVSNFAELDREVIEHLFTTSAVDAVLPPPPSEDMEELPAGPEIRPMFMVLYVDNENLDPIHRNRVLRRVREFVAENLNPPVQMMVASYERRLKVVQPFTDDPTAINGALTRLHKVSGGRADRDSDLREILEKIQEEAAQEVRHEGRENQRAIQQRFRQQIMAFAEQEANNVNLSLEAIKQAMAMISGLEGRKSMVYISSGLPMSPGIGLMQEYSSAFHDPSFMGRRFNTDRTSAFQGLTSAANAQDVTLYTIDASGLNPLDGYGADSAWGNIDPTAASMGMKTYQDSLRYMARYTGGISIVNTNDISSGLELITHDLFSYYSLGYTISTSGQDRVHKIDVEVVGHPEYDLRYRRRFVEKSWETQVQDRVYSALMVEVEDNPMDLQLDRGRASPASADRWSVPLHLSFPLATIALVPQAGDYVGQVVLFLGARDLDGRGSELQRQEHEIRIPAEHYDTAVEQRFGIDFQLLLLEGQHRVGIGLMDRVTRQAAYDRIVVTVPQ